MHVGVSEHFWSARHDSCSVAACARARGRGRGRVCRHVFGAASEHVTAELFLFLQLSRLIHDKASRTAGKHSAPVVSGDT